MTFYFNMPRGAFIGWLRDKSIAGGMCPQFIAALDDLDSFEDIEAENADLNEQLQKAEDAHDDLLGELDQLIEVLQEDGPEAYPPAVEAAIKVAEAAIERHRECAK